jgi:hypothetical protein
MGPTATPSGSSTISASGPVTAEVFNGWDGRRAGSVLMEPRARRITRNLDHIWGQRRVRAGQVERKASWNGADPWDVSCLAPGVLAFLLFLPVPARTGRSAVWAGHMAVHLIGDWPGWNDAVGSGVIFVERPGPVVVFEYRIF